METIGRMGFEVLICRFAVFGMLHKGFGRSSECCGVCLASAVGGFGFEVCRVEGFFSRMLSEIRDFKAASFLVSGS